MKIFYRIVRFCLVALLTLVVVLPVASYVALSLPGVQRRVASVAEKELTTLLGVNVTIDNLNISPFNKVVIRRVALCGEQGDTIATIGRLGAGVQLGSLFFEGPIVISHIELIGLDARLRRDSLTSPLNIQPIIDALQPKDPSAPPKPFDLRINTVMIRKSAVSYDVASEPESEDAGIFNPAHIRLTDLRADLRFPQLKNGDFTIDLRRFGVTEQSGLTIENLSGFAHISDRELGLRRLKLELPGSHLEFGDIALARRKNASIADLLDTNPFTLKIEPGGTIALSELVPLLPALRGVNATLDIDRFAVTGPLTDARAEVALKAPGAAIGLQAKGVRLLQPERSATLENLRVDLDPARCGAWLPAELTERSGWLSDILRWNRLQLTARATADARGGRADIAVNTPEGTLALSGEINLPHPNDLHGVVKFNIGETEADSVPHALRLSRLFPSRLPIDILVADGDAEFTLRGGKPETGKADLRVSEIAYKGITYNNLTVGATLANQLLEATAKIDNAPLAFNLSGCWGTAPRERRIGLQGEIARICPAAMRLSEKLPADTYSGKVGIDLEGEDLAHLYGTIALMDVAIERETGATLTIDNISIGAAPRRIIVAGDLINGELLGDYDFTSLPLQARQIASRLLPSCLPDSKVPATLAPNNFRFSFDIAETEAIADAFPLPVSNIYTGNLSGHFDSQASEAAVTLALPYLRQGTKLIENTRLDFAVAKGATQATLDFTTTTPTKEGGMRLNLSNTLRPDTLLTAIDWKIDRRRAYFGAVNATTIFSPGAKTLKGERAVIPDIAVNLHRSALTFNDSTWIIDPARISISHPTDISVDGLNVHNADQYVKIDGRVSADPLSVLTLDLRSFSLDYLFETLGIDKVMLGGEATGTFYASSLLTHDPVITTPGLRVRNISYNTVVLGDADVRSYWDKENRAVRLDADIAQGYGGRSEVHGAIYPFSESLDITFLCNHVKVGFMENYMNAFASDISGYASGRARIFGTFKYIDLEGAVKADSLRMKVNFTNTYYSTSDSVTFSPGLIDLRRVRISDSEGHTAMLNGKVRHKFFKEPSFDFAITGARDFLSYDQTARDNDRWYGRVYGNGAVYVKGEPGRVDINVDMATAQGSTFTFVLSDNEVAEQYSFLTFRDRNRLTAELTDTILLHNTSMELVNHLRALAASHGEDEVSDYNISLQMRVTPEARIVLVMDPVAGDRIRATGSGHLRMSYGSANNDLKMYGTYTLERGSYNFTLQDVIIKDFTIKPGSSIAFNGDPYAAQLDIKAVYALNANLSDLDESFLQDKDLNRTNVPVHALMIVTGDIRQPEIAFDLEFPTLSSDIYQKVRSIISTDDMMNRQIIYLLALNRFYTPEYMASTTKGNELLSVASSTISSQLSNLLGQISDNWNIAPTFRSDRGDFSDVEVDVALSSRLLNNRLLFNGNLGYRDNAMNTNQFIGDFDLEYILDSDRIWRLRAYNRYNDQNYYLRTAHTTQGVGVVLKRDFDSFFSFLRPLRRNWLKKKEKSKQPVAPQPPAEQPQSQPAILPVKKSK